MLDTLEALRPLLAEIIVLLLSPFVAAALLKAQAYLGLKTEARHREALHMALMTGVRSLADGSRTPEQLAEAAVAYARRSVPDAIAALKAPESILRQIAEAKANDVLGQWINVQGETLAREWDDAGLPPVR